MAGNTWSGRAADRFGAAPALFALLTGSTGTVAALWLVGSARRGVMRAQPKPREARIGHRRRSTQLIYNSVV
jgi:hypothetical protein